VQKVAVSPDRRGEGLARTMHELIYAARCADVERLTVDVRGDNTPAIALYESLGFTRYGTLPEFITVRDARYDKAFYCLDLRKRAPG
jgi:ribosomal protein S18 acetylase RimI-like enzyme